MKKILYVLIALSTLGCKKMIEIDSPKYLLSNDKVFSDSTSTLAALSSAYSIFNERLINIHDVALSLYADELTTVTTTGTDFEFRQSVVTPTNGNNGTIWQRFYSIIYQCNAIIENVELSTTFSQPFEAKIINEAKFLRGLSYFYLVSYYDHIPLLLTTDVNKIVVASQVSSGDVFNQMISDFKDAKLNLSSNYATSGKVRANKWAAAAMLARTYLYQGNWSAAETESNELITNGGYGLLDNLSLVFKANSKETIFEFSTTNGFTSIGSRFVPANNTSIPIYPLTTFLYESFEPGDLRKTQWVGINVVTTSGVPVQYYYPSKYKNRSLNTSGPENLVALRLAEQYLIRAEARIQLGRTDEGISDLNLLRKRSRALPTVLVPDPLPAFPNGLSKTSALTAVLKEEQIEFFAEWGHRFLSLKHSGLLNERLTDFKSTWLPRSVVLPIPQNELIYDLSLKQNQGY